MVLLTSGTAFMRIIYPIYALTHARYAKFLKFVDEAKSL